MNTSELKTKIQRAELELKELREEHKLVEEREAMRVRFLALRPQSMTQSEALDLEMFLPSMTEEESEQKTILQQMLSDYKALELLRKMEKNKRLARIQDELDHVRKAYHESPAFQAHFITPSFEQDLAKTVCGILRDADVTLEEFYGVNGIESILLPNERSAFQDLSRENYSTYARDLQSIAFPSVAPMYQQRERDKAESNLKRMSWRDLLQSGIDSTAFSSVVDNLNRLYEQSLRDAEKERERQQAFLAQKQIQTQIDQERFEFYHPSPIHKPH